MCSLHVLRGSRYGDVEVEIEAQNRPCDEHDEHGEGGVFEVRDLNLHTSKFHPPANICAGRRRLDSHVLPICGLDVLEMVRSFRVKLLQILGEYDNRVTNKEMRE